MALTQIAELTDSLCYRLWCESFDSLRLVNIQWGVNHFCELYSLRRELRNDSTFLTVYSKEPKTPKSGWPIFFKKIDDLNMARVKDIRQLVKPNFFLWEEADDYVIELLDHGVAKTFFFIQPYYYKKKLKDAATFSSFLDLLESEFGLKINDPKVFSDTLIKVDVELRDSL